MSVFEPLQLPEPARLELCRNLLAEFGARKVSETSSGELLHCCIMPWHEDRNPSAYFSYEKLTYICFSCGSGGGLLWLIATCRGENTREARRWVENSTGIGGGEFELSALLSLFDAMYEPEKARTRTIPSYGVKVLDPWRAIHPWLTDPPEDGGRGVPEENLVRMQVGYAQEYPMAQDEDGNVTRTSERIVVPHIWRDKLVGWQSRRLDGSDGTPKWLSTPNFPKDLTLFNHDPARHRTAIVVESPMTVLRHLHHQHIVGTFGAMVTDRQVRLMADYDRVILWMDPDFAGWQAMDGYTADDGDYHPGIVDRLSRTTDVWAVDTDYAVDGGDMDDDTVDALVEQAVPAALWQRPQVLRCWDCKKRHSGNCAEEV